MEKGQFFARILGCFVSCIIIIHVYFLGNTVSHLGHTIFAQGILGSKDHGGFLYVKPTFQCTHKLLMPPAPYIFGILLQKWETPWAKIFPIRLMLRLGAEFRCKILEHHLQTFFVSLFVAMLGLMFNLYVKTTRSTYM